MNALERYAEAIRLKEAGDLDGSATALSLALGSDEQLPAVRSSLDALLSPNDAIAQPLLQQMLKQVENGKVGQEV